MRNARSAVDLVAVVFVLLLASCGSDSPSQPSTSPTPSARALVYARQAVYGHAAEATVSVVAVDSATGEPSVLRTTTIPRARELAVDPFNRFLYVAGYDDGASPCTTCRYLRSYGVDRASGELTLRSEVQYAGNLSAVAANASAVVVVSWMPAGVSHTHRSLSSYGVDPASGALTASPSSLQLSQEAPLLVVDPGSSSFFTIADENSSQPWRNSIDSYRFDAAVPTGLRLVASSPVPDDVTSSLDAVVAGRHLILSDRDTLLDSFSLDRTTGRVAYEARSEVRSISSVDGAGRWLASATIEALRLYEVTADGQILLRDEQARTLGSVIAFDPSGRCVYSTEREGLRVYAVTSEGRLEERGLVAGLRGQLAVARPPE